MPELGEIVISDKPFEAKNTEAQFKGCRRFKLWPRRDGSEEVDSMIVICEIK